MRLEQPVQNNKMIETKQMVPGKQRKVSALFGAFAFVSKLYQIKLHLYAALLGLFVWSPQNDCVGQVFQSKTVQ